MRVRLVQITVRPNGKQAQREDHLECNAVRIGRAPGNEIELSGLAVAMHHGTIESHIDGPYIVPVRDNEILVNGQRITDEALVEAGDSVRIGGHELRILPAAAGEHLAVEVEQVAGKTSEFDALKRRTNLKLERGAWARRPWSWGAVGAVLLLALLVPLATGWRGIWTSGELSRKHSFIADDCSQCHSAFQRAPDAKCLSCHTGITSHASSDTTLEELESANCSSCHLEHNGASGLAALEEALCSDCHSDLSTRVATKLQDVSDFQDNHPQFLLHMSEPTESDAHHVELREWAPDLREKSGLKFDHALHNVEVLGAEDAMCGYCHTMDQAGRYMQPVLYEEQCADCHVLSEYDPFIRSELSHAPPDEVRRELTALYLETAFAGKAQADGGPAFTYMAEPGYSPTNTQRRAIDRWVERSLADAERRLYVDGEADEDEVADDGNDRALGTCVMCHDVKAQGTPGRAPQLGAVAVTERWVPTSQFAHGTHLPFQCATCHPAAAVLEHNERTPVLAQPGMIPYGTLNEAELKERTGLSPSSSASDVLVLGVESCRECHASSQAQPPEVASPCVMCHPFHRYDQQKITDRRAARARAVEQPPPPEPAAEDQKSAREAS